MRKGRQTQMQRIAHLEEALAKMYMLIQTILDKLPEEKEEKKSE